MVTVFVLFNILFFLELVILFFCLIFYDFNPNLASGAKHSSQYVPSDQAF